MEAPDDLGFDYRPDLPVTISCVTGRYLLFDVKVATWLRREHNICGTTIGSLPLSPSQNLFLGIPVEIMPEEAQLLSERGVAVVIDDAQTHSHAIRGLGAARRADYLALLKNQTKQVEDLRNQEKAKSKKRGLEKLAKKLKAAPESTAVESPRDMLEPDETKGQQFKGADKVELEIDSTSTSSLQLTPSSQTSYGITPATSQALLPASSAAQMSTIADLPSSYPLYRHLHDKGYFMTPGLRFGCQYTVYPGDPLRFHSHFLAVGSRWEQEIDLMEIVGGGRLGTGVKKGFLLGGESPAGDVRTFSVEWAAM